MMDDPRKLRWDEIVWKALLRSLAHTPPAVRMEALLSIVDEAERVASSGWVGENEVLIAIEGKVPKSLRRYARAAFIQELESLKNG